LEVDESPGSVLAVGVLDERKTVVGPANVDGCEGEGERCEGGRPNSENDWCMAVRNLVRYIDAHHKGTNQR